MFCHISSFYQHLPVEWPQELHPALVGDHGDRPRHGVLPARDQAEANPAEADLGVAHAVEAVLLLHLLQLGNAEKKSKSNDVIYQTFRHR